MTDLNTILLKSLVKIQVESISGSGSGFIIDLGSTNFSFILTAKHTFVSNHTKFMETDKTKIIVKSHHLDSIPILSIYQSDGLDLAILKTNYIDTDGVNLISSNYLENFTPCKLHCPLQDNTNGTIYLESFTGVYEGNYGDPVFKGLKIEHQVDFSSDKGLRENFKGFSGSPILTEKKIMGILIGNKSKRFDNKFKILPSEKIIEYIMSNFTLIELNSVFDFFNYDQKYIEKLKCPLLYPKKNSQRFEEFLQNLTISPKNIVLLLQKIKFATECQFSKVTFTELNIFNKKVWNGFLLFLFTSFYINNEYPKISEDKICVIGLNNSDKDVYKIIDDNIKNLQEQDYFNPDRKKYLKYLFLNCENFEQEIINYAKNYFKNKFSQDFEHVLVFSQNSVPINIDCTNFISDVSNLGNNLSDKFDITHGIFPNSGIIITDSYIFAQYQRI